MDVFHTETYQVGDDVVVNLPDALGFAPGQRISIERVGNALQVVSLDAMPEEAPEESRIRVRRLIDALNEIGPMDEVGKRDPIEFPDRPGLY